MSYCTRIETFVHATDPVDVFDTVECAGTMVSGSHRTINIYFLIYRVFASCYVTFICLWILYNYVSDDFLGYMFIYLTHWSIWINALYMWSSTILHLVVYRIICKQQAEKDVQRGGNASFVAIHEYPTIDNLKLRSLWRFVLVTLDTTVSVSMFIILLYWGLVHDYTGSVKAISWNTHGVGGGLVLIDFFCNTWQLTYKGAIFPFLFGFIFIIFSIIYYAAGGTNEFNGERYIYSALNWGTPGIAAAYSGTIVVILTLSHLGLVALKNKVIIGWLKTRTPEEKAALIQTNDLAGNQSITFAQNDEIGDFDTNRRISAVSQQSLEKHKSKQNSQTRDENVNPHQTAIELSPTNKLEGVKSIPL